MKSVVGIFNSLPDAKRGAAILRTLGIPERRINEHLGANLQPEQFIVIGDTPNDIACARHFGARVVSVATGHIHSADILREHEPDALLPDLLNAELVMRTLDDL